MYFPYLRGRQYELLAIGELIDNNLLNDHVIPVVEPVKLSFTLIHVMEKFIKAKHPIAIISNPAVGNFILDWKDIGEKSKETSYKNKFIGLYKEEQIIKSVIMKNDINTTFDSWEKNGVNRDQFSLIVNINRDFLDKYGEMFKVSPKYVLIPDESAFKRKVRDNKVLFNDRFQKKSRNVDYQESVDEFFSDDHLYYQEDGFVGFSDYSVIGSEYSEAGFAPYAVVIHIVYFAADRTLRIRHFVSDSNNDISNPALKYYEALQKLKDWYSTKEHQVNETMGLNTFLKHYKGKSYSGLGTIKKLSLMHHLELMGKYLAEVK